MSQEPPRSIGAVACRYGCPARPIRRLGARGLLPAGPRVDAYRIVLLICLGWFPFNSRCRDRDVPRHFSSDAPITVGSGVEDVDRLAGQGVATPGDLLAIDPLDLHTRSVRPDDAPPASSSVQRTRPSILSLGRLMPAAMGGFFLLLLLCLLVVATLLVGRHADTPPRSRQDGYLRIAQGPQGNAYRFTRLSVRFSHLLDWRSSQPGWAEYASLIPRTEKEKSRES